MRPFHTAALLLSLVSAGFPHLTANSLKMTGASPYRAIDSVTVSWAVGVPHGGVNVDYSADGGKTWKTLKANISARSAGNYTYKWGISEAPTEKAKLRICQMGGSTPCTNADSVNRPSSGSNYVLISNVFAIQTATALAPSRATAAPTLSMNADGSLEAAFTLPADGEVSLIAYDSKGREAALLSRGRYPAGAHRFSLFSEALRGHRDWIVRLEAAGKVQVLAR